MNAVKRNAVELYGPQGRLPPAIHRSHKPITKIIDPNYLGPSQTNLIMKQRKLNGATKPLKAKWKLQRPQYRSIAQFGTADVGPSIAPMSIDQKLDFDKGLKGRNVRMLINPQQSGGKAPKAPKEAKIKQKHTINPPNSSDIGFDGPSDPNPIVGLPTIDPVQQAQTIQPQFYDGHRIVVPSKSFKQYLGKTKNSGGVKYKRQIDNVTHNQVALVQSAVQNFLYRRGQDELTLVDATSGSGDAEQEH